VRYARLKKQPMPPKFNLTAALRKENDRVRMAVKCLQEPSILTNQTPTTHTTLLTADPSRRHDATKTTEHRKPAFDRLTQQFPYIPCKWLCLLTAVTAVDQPNTSGNRVPRFTV